MITKYLLIGCGLLFSAMGYFIASTIFEELAAKEFLNALGFVFTLAAFVWFAYMAYRLNKDGEL